MDTASQQTPEEQLWTAATNRRVRDVVRLLQSGVCNMDERNRDGRSAMLLASELGHAGVGELLIKAGAQVDCRDRWGWTPLHKASVIGHRESVQLLLMQGAADVNLLTPRRNSPLYLATLGGHGECARLLTRAGGQSDFQDLIGYCALHIAAQHRYTDVLQQLLASGADLNLRTDAGETPLHIAAWKGHIEQVLCLLDAGADPDVLNRWHSSPLHLAAMMGFEETVQKLLHAECNAGLLDDAGLSAAGIACCFGQRRVLIELMLHVPVSGDLGNILERLRLPTATDELLLAVQQQHTLRYPVINSQLKRGSVPGGEVSSERFSPSESYLSKAMSNAGFIHCRAAVQSALADVLLEILSRRLMNTTYNTYNIVGSYADGWGNSLHCLNGVTDMDADIDETTIMPHREFHLRGLCRCSNVDPDDIVEFINGHVQCPLSSSTPADSWIGSSMRPAIDLISAYRCCTYPPIELFEAQRLTQIPPDVLQSLVELSRSKASPCHLVAAAPPGLEGQRMRVSTSFLERRLMRSMNDVQGQVFMVIKYLVKKVLAQELARTLKSYHVKTLMFYMLDETLSDDWQPTNIHSLTRRALLKLHGWLLEETDSDKLMRHFFLRDAWVYLRKGHRSKSEISDALSKVMDHLPPLMEEFERNLRPLNYDGLFTFHPFLNLPHIESQPVPPESAKVPYHSTPDLARYLLTRLSQEECTQQLQEFILREVQRLPDFAATTRHTLIALTYLKFKEEDKAAEVLRDSMHSEVSKGVPTSCATVDAVREHLESTDSAWKFCWWFEEQLPCRMNFLDTKRKSISRYFPYRMQYVSWYFVNMRALHRCLCLLLEIADEASSWFAEVLDSSHPDVQELAMTLEFCMDNDLLVQLIHRHRSLICDNKEVGRKVLERFRDDKSLVNLSIMRTLEALKSDAT